MGLRELPMKIATTFCLFKPQSLVNAPYLAHLQEKYFNANKLKFQNNLGKTTDLVNTSSQEAKLKKRTTF